MEINVKRYLEILMEENQRQNLVSRKTARSDLDQHVSDCLQVLEWYSLSGENIIDIGSGAGFPGLVLALAEPGCQMTLVESDWKKSEFLELVVNKLEISNIEVIRERVENLGRDCIHRGSFDLCTSRAVAVTRILLEYGMPLVKTGGRLLLWKGSQYQAEMDEAQQALKILGGRVETVHPYSLMHESDRVIVSVQKISPTPPQYPRKVGTPSKRPL